MTGSKRLRGRKHRPDGVLPCPDPARGIRRISFRIVLCRFCLQSVLVRKWTRSSWPRALRMLRSRPKGDTIYVCPTIYSTPFNFADYSAGASVESTTATPSLFSTLRTFDIPHPLSDLH